MNAAGSPAVTRRDWWLGVALVVGAILVHAAWPRYDWRHIAGGVFVRIDRWTGVAVIGRTGGGVDGRWTSTPPPLTTPHSEPPEGRRP